MLGLNHDKNRIYERPPSGPKSVLNLTPSFWTAFKEATTTPHIAGDYPTTWPRLRLPFIETWSKRFLSLIWEITICWDFRAKKFQTTWFSGPAVRQTKLSAFQLVWLQLLVPEKAKKSIWKLRPLLGLTADWASTGRPWLHLRRCKSKNCWWTLDGPIIKLLCILCPSHFLYDYPYFQRFNAFLKPSFHRLLSNTGWKRLFSVIPITATKAVIEVRYHMSFWATSANGNWLGTFLMTSV